MGIRAEFTTGAFLALMAAPAFALTIQAPAPGSVNTISPGDDYASAILTDAWDMSDAGDLELRKSHHLTGQSIAGGIFTGSTTDNVPAVYPLYPGVYSSVPTHKGSRYPVDTQRYRYLTIKVRAYGTGSNPDPSAGQAMVQAFYFRDQDALVTNQWGCSGNAFYAPGTDWQIVTLDMQQGGTCSPSMPWTSGTIQGLRIDPVRAAGVKVDIDWIRLTSAAVTSQQRYQVSWTDTVQGASYTVTAIDPDGARFTLGQNIVATALLADFSRLAPGDYRIEVSRGGASATSTGVVRVAAPATVSIADPSMRGDVSRSYANTVLGNPWGPIDSQDFYNLVNITNPVYNNPPGTLTARATNNDPSVFMQTRRNNTFFPINTQLYRSVCFTMQLFGPQDIGAGSVARLYWGNEHPTLTASDDIVIEEGVNEYCFEDMAEMPMEGANLTPWLADIIRFFRIDPHEFPVHQPPISQQCQQQQTHEACRDFRIHSVTLSPFAVARPGFNVSWTHRDTDSNGHTVRVLLDQNRTAGDGPEYPLRTVTRSPGTHTLGVHVPPGVPLGKYYVALEVQDAHATVRAYSTGPLLVEAPQDLIFANGFQP
jgi:hypothetical protein